MSYFGGRHLSFSGVRVTRSLVSCVHFVDRFVCPFSFDHCVSSIYGFLLSLWHLQTLLNCISHMIGSGRHTSTYPSGAPEFTPGFSGVRVSLVSSNSS
jgi:hypothetical protein